MGEIRRLMLENRGEAETREIDTEERKGEQVD